jgi:hypothetical protein
MSSEKKRSSTKNLDDIDDIDDENKEEEASSCDGLSFEDCQLNILRDAMDKAEKNLSKKVAQSPVVKNIFKIIEKFIKSHKMMIYGGTAINNILPRKLRFYNTDVDVPDYDVFSDNPIENVKEISDIFYEKGYKNVVAKSGSHIGTYKVFVNYLPVLDVTYMDTLLLDTLLRESITKDGLHYSPVNLLRFSMYGELSRPQSEPDRWEKVYKRLVILNKAYPFHYDKCKTSRGTKKNKRTNGLSKPNFLVIRNALIENNVIFIGGYVNTLFGTYLKTDIRKSFDTITHFDVLSPNPKGVAKMVKEQLNFIGNSDISIIKRKAYGELIPPSYVIKVNGKVVCVIYKSTHCHAFNKIQINGKQVNIGSIDTLLHFYLAFYYAVNTKYKSYYEPDKLLCMSQFLFEIQEHNKLSQKGLLKRFVTDCEGHETTREESRQQLDNKYNELKGDKKSKEYEKYFLKYYPGNNTKRKTSSKIRTTSKTDSIGLEDSQDNDSNSDSDSDSNSDSDSDSNSDSDSDSDSNSDSDSDEHNMEKKEMDGNEKTKSQVISQLKDNIVEYSKKKTQSRKSFTTTKKKQTKKGRSKKPKSDNFFQIF